ncbi:MAG: hypothetical protein EOP04_01160 [Proteobacteria bacterium]|nr:MAG: hypothetical protein EOP04_01160 [Pseudomonadota bacterium]
MKMSGTMPRLLFLFSQLCILGIFTACKTTSSELASQTSDTKVQAFIHEMYSKYNSGYVIQDDADTPDDCASFYVPSSPNVAPKGVAVLFHGYTACPQQYWELSQRLKENGYATLAVLLPGQGRGPAPFAYAGRLTGQEEVSAPIQEKDLRMIDGRHYADYYAEFIPKVQNGEWKRYLEFVEDVNKFAKSLPGEKVVGGLSVGGELANYAYIHSPTLYKRALLIAPFYGMPGPDLIEKFSGVDLDSEALYKYQKKIVTLGSRLLPEVAKTEISWGKDCYLQTRGKDGNPGRRGICDFQWQHLAATNSVGDYVLSLLKDRKELTEVPKVQYVAVDWDIGSNTVLARKAIAYQQTRFGTNQVLACFYPHSVPHALISRKDLSLLPATPWLDGFESQTVDFLVSGKPFAYDVKPSQEFIYDSTTGADMNVKQFACAMEAAK